MILNIPIGAGAWVSKPTQPVWTDYVATYQAHYSKATLAHVTQTDTEKQSQLDDVLASIDKSADFAMFMQFHEAE